MHFVGPVLLQIRTTALFPTAQLNRPTMMKIPSFLRSAIARQPIAKSLTPALCNSSYSTLQRVNFNPNSKPVDQKQNDVMQTMLLQQIVSEQQKVNALITSIQSLQVKEQQKVNDLITSIQSLRVVDTKDVNVLTFPDVAGGFQALNRSARAPRRANRGKRPVSRVARRNKRRRHGNHRR